MDPQTALRQRMREIAHARVRFGYRRIYIMLRREGWDVGHCPKVSTGPKIDQQVNVVRPGFTFRLAPGWPGMLENKKARLIVVSRDSYIPGEPSEAADLVTPVLRKVLDFMGIRDVDVVRAGGSLAVNLGKVRIEDHLAKYEAEIAALARV
jgi:hypothetical protein